LKATNHEPPLFWTDRQYNDPQQPVVGVSWYDAVKYCEWLSEVTGRAIALPSEAQWEFAARGPENWLYPWGNEEPDENLAHFDKNYDDAPLPVGSKPAGRGPFGTLDQAGNVDEWCRDAWDAGAYRRPDRAQRDPLVVAQVGPEGSDQSPDEVRAVRGGAFFDPALILRAAFRPGVRALTRNFLGFRVVSFPASAAMTGN
jgi:formylglycine-generating enzyme required for sulfatase activity